jgi:hypothetical protein
MEIKFVPPKVMSREEYMREFEWHVRMICTRFEMKLIIVTQHYMIANEIRFDDPTTAMKHITRMVHGAILRFGEFLLRLPENVHERDAQRRYKKIKMIDQGIPAHTVDEILDLPVVIGYPFSSSNDPIELHDYKLIQKLDAFIAQYFDAISLERPELYEKDLSESPKNVVRAMVYSHELTREMIMSSLLNMESIDVAEYFN